MVTNFDELIASINDAETRGKLEEAFDIAHSFLETWLNTSIITLDDYKQKVIEVREAYNNQLVDYIHFGTSISGFIGLAQRQMTAEIDNENH